MNGTLFEGTFPFIIVVLIFVIVLIMNTVKNVKRAKKKKPKRTMSAGTEGLNRTFTASGEKKSIKEFRRLEDRENDWLARQLREEKASEKKFSAMFGLKMEHARRCDANGIDNAEGR